MTYRHRTSTLLAIALSLTAPRSAVAQSASSPETQKLTGYEVTQITGLPQAKPNIKGRLTMPEKHVIFTNSEFTADIPFARITSVSIGNERMETGGKTGRILRTIIPYGGGIAVATVTQKAVDLLTIEYLDLQGGYHGAVFFVPKLSAKALTDRMSSQLLTTAPQISRLCESGPARSSSVIVEPIVTRGVELPAEYRVLLYEGLIHELRDNPSPDTYIRGGSSDAGSGCSSMKLQITVTGFKKGNQALRASTGPIGLFVGKTSVSYHVELTAADGHSVLAKDMTNSKRMDTESLDVAKSVAKAVAKRLHRLPTQQSAS